ncbi:DNA cytosine methyltransferase [Spiroplasma endosymbiont of Nebria brevicollis]|uniref:DNA cytosine methyltransferase n=1 Tax=Spiroplasma endosymbiont of Nebria brevicollis TaxID=3066284 RepID=UPI00313BBB2F
MNHSEQMLLKMSYVKEGKGRECIPEELKPKTGDIRKYIRLDSNKPSFCITTDNRKVFHYSLNRALTIRELARIQTFPDSFIFYGNRSSQEKQIGNAVPLKLSEKFAKKIKEYLNE